jgi:hypothetical protein
MTNPTFLDHGAVLPHGIAALAPVGRQRPVKVVELPVFRAARARLDSPFTVLRLPAVSLDGAAELAADGRRTSASTPPTTRNEAA